MREKEYLDNKLYYLHDVLEIYPYVAERAEDVRTMHTWFLKDIGYSSSEAASKAAKATVKEIDPELPITIDTPCGIPINLRAKEWAALWNPGPIRPGEKDTG